MGLLLQFLIAVVPCIIWLLFYLRQDVHPEPPKKVIEIFFWGGMFVIPIILAEKLLTEVLPFSANQQNGVGLLLYFIIVIGLVEEFFKYLVVRIRIIKSSYFDEPVDAMIYLIIAALGIAAVENILVITNILSFKEAIFTSSIRLITAIFLHTLGAAIIGFFLAYSLRFKKIKRKLTVGFGIILASVLHGLYDFFMLKSQEAEKISSFLAPIGIIALMVVIVYFLFLRVKKIPRSCNYKIK